MNFIIELHNQMEYHIIKEIKLYTGMNIDNALHVNTPIYVHDYTYMSLIEQILIFNAVLFYLE